MLSKRQYQHIIGRQQKHEVIAYQIRQSFKPGEITPEEANRLGRELALRFTKGDYAFIVATHTDRAHIHNHIVFNSTSIDGTKKFKDFHQSGRALQKVSDMICLENGLSVIEPKPYGEQTARSKYPIRTSKREELCTCLDEVFKKKPKNMAELVEEMRQAGYECKEGKHLAFRHKNAERFIRLDSLPDGYKEADIARKLGVRMPDRPVEKQNEKVNLILDIQSRMTGKGPGYERWAKKFNLKQMAKSLLFLRDHNIDSLEDLNRLVKDKTKERDSLLSEVKASETRLAEIATLKKHIINYSKTREIYADYRKAGYSKKFLEEHREEISLHKAAKQAFDELGVKQIPKVKELNAEYAQILADKKKLYSEYQGMKDELKELLTVQGNVLSLYDDTKTEEQVKKKGAKDR